MAAVCRLPAHCPSHRRTQFLPRKPREIGKRVFCCGRWNPLVCQWSGIRGGLSFRCVLPRYLRDDCLLWLRRLPLFDRLSGGLGRRALCGRRADEADGEVYLRRCARQPFPVAWHPASRRAQHPGGQPLLSDSADGGSRRPGQTPAGPSAMGGRRDGRRGGHPDRHHSWHGKHHVCPVPQRGSLGHLFIRPDRADPPEGPSGRCRLLRRQTASSHAASHRDSRKRKMDRWPPAGTRSQPSRSATSWTNRLASLWHPENWAPGSDRIPEAIPGKPDRALGSHSRQGSPREQNHHLRAANRRGQ